MVADVRKRRVLALTGIRSEYFLQRSILDAISRHPLLELEVVVAGAHLSSLHDYTVGTVRADGFSIVGCIESLLHSDRQAARLKGAALQLQVLCHLVDDRRPDWLLAVGDREEPLLLAMCGAYMNIATAHYGAGDRAAGNVDDMVRHAISRLAHLLLTTNENARQFLVQSGEQDWRVHNVGHAGLDRIRQAPVLAPRELALALGVPAIASPYLVVIQHPLSSEVDQASEQMRETLEAVVQLGLPAFVSHPNSDPGSGQMIEILEEYRSHRHVHIFHSIADIPFVNLLRRASALVGNSSLGFLEAPFLKLPAVNVGRRQSGRHHAANVFFVDHDRQKIVEAVRSAIEDEHVRAQVRACANPFGDGHAAERVATLLAEFCLDDRLLIKDLTY